MIDSSITSDSRRFSRMPSISRCTSSSCACVRCISSSTWPSASRTMRAASAWAVLFMSSEAFCALISALFSVLSSSRYWVSDASSRITSWRSRSFSRSACS